MKLPNYVAFLSILAVLAPLSAFARDKNQHSVDIPSNVQVGGKRLEAGSYKVEWQGAGPDVQVTFLRHGKAVATVPGTLKTNDSRVTADAIQTDSSSNTLNEIDFGRDKEALVFQSGM
ncbi:MAG: hypothetical protein ABSF72_10025 [Candidatus Sulfotelmatobacter sp.]|jgi:hypothetical protein